MSTLPPPIPPPSPGPLPISGGTGGPDGTATAPPVRARTIQILWLVLAVIVIAAVVNACEHHENTYEKLTHQLTAAVQNNDMAAVQKLENAETAAEMTRARLGAAADTLSPLGKIDRVRETTGVNEAPRVHEFEVLFDKNIVRETVQFDPDDKIVHFHYDAPKKR
jgi:hypothetical protein